MRGEQILCRRSAPPMEFHSHIIPHVVNVISHAGPSSQSGSDVIIVRLKMCVICACRRLDRVWKPELRYNWAWKRGFTAETEYNNSGETSLKLKTEFWSPLKRESSIPGSRHRASCAETDLM